jgi:hypothetical protein
MNIVESNMLLILIRIKKILLSQLSSQLFNNRLSKLSSPSRAT